MPGVLNIKLRQPVIHSKGKIKINKFFISFNLHVVYSISLCIRRFLFVDLKVLDLN